MKPSSSNSAKHLQRDSLNTAVAAAEAAGSLLRQNFHRPKKINSQVQHDIKLELDVRSQELIEKRLLHDFPDGDILGEEGVSGTGRAELRWVIDPIDGTVNFAHNIPHACVSIALQQRTDDGAYETVTGVVLDPFCHELWTATLDGPARLNRRIIKVSERNKLKESIVAIGFAKNKWTLNRMLPLFNLLIHRCRKIRMMGAAALALTYVASGRFDAYVEGGIRLWDIAAGGLILERAGGDFHHQQIKRGPHTFELIANNGLLRKPVERLLRQTELPES